MTPRGLSSPDLRKRNRTAILRLIHRHGGLARNDLAVTLGLSRASVTYLVDELMEDGLLAEGGTPESGGKVGRRKTLLHILPDAGCVLGIAADVERLQLVLADLAGSVSSVLNLPSSGRPDLQGDEAARVLTEAVAGAAAGILPADRPLLGAGLVVTGRVDCDAGVSLREPRLWAGPVPLREPLAEALGARVGVDNNVRALALAELLLTEARASAPSGLLFVKYGPGVGAAWAVGGAPWPGAHFRSGELGHTLVEADGPPCPYCGRRGCLESLASARALGELMDRPGTRLEELCSALEAGYPEAFTTLATRFARALGNAIEVCDPSRVALYGQAFLTGRLFDEIASRVESNERPCEIARSGLDPALPALGGAALALDRFFLGRGA